MQTKDNPSSVISRRGVKTRRSPGRFPFAEGTITAPDPDGNSYTRVSLIEVPSWAESAELVFLEHRRLSPLRAELVEQNVRAWMIEQQDPCAYSEWEPKPGSGGCPW